jgi:hypothetical protein
MIITRRHAADTSSSFDAEAFSKKKMNMRSFPASTGTWRLFSNWQWPRR